MTFCCTHFCALLFSMLPCQLSEGFHAACVANICCKHECCCSNLMAHAQHFLRVMKPDVQGCRKPSCLRCPTFFWLLVQPEQQSFSCLLADLGAHPEIKFQTVTLQVCASHSISAGCCAWCLVDLQHPSFHWGHAPGARLAALANTQVIHTPKAVCKLNSAEILLPRNMHLHCRFMSIV